MQQESSESLGKEETLLKDSGSDTKRNSLAGDGEGRGMQELRTWQGEINTRAG